jgi:hypothetical protein
MSFAFLHTLDTPFNLHATPHPLAASATALLWHPIREEEERV